MSSSIWAFVLKNAEHLQAGGSFFVPSSFFIHSAFSAHAKQTGFTVQVPVLSLFEFDAIPVTLFSPSPCVALFNASVSLQEAQPAGQGTHLS